MFNPRTEQHRMECRCEPPNHPTNQEPPEDELILTTQSYGERLRASGERTRLAQDWARELWMKGFRGECLWYNVLAMFEPATWDEAAHNVWREVRNNIG